MRGFGKKAVKGAYCAREFLLGAKMVDRLDNFGFRAFGKVPESVGLDSA
jgi:hypothetical protein